MYRLLPLLLVLVFSGYAVAGPSLGALAEEAVFGDSDASARAISRLRTHKQEGLDAIFIRFRGEIEAFRNTAKSLGQWQRISAALDAVSQQKDAYASRLFWHTDLDEAMLEASRQNKPIVSLRLLGDLSEEYSCANSRFFRSILYTDPAVAENLRKNFVLHWKSVRPAPKLTVDFGDGRKLVRTITGNSIHYVLSDTGMVYDALPGLYDPATFNSYLNELQALVKNSGGALEVVNGYRFGKGRVIVEEWQERLAKLGKEINEDSGEEWGLRIDSSQPTAVEAMPRAVTKAAVERPAVLALMPKIDNLQHVTELDDWKQMARLSAPVRISDESLNMIRAKSGEISDEEFRRLVTNLKELIAIDTVQNEYRFHLKILSLINSATRIEPLNQHIYANLFLTPDSDKWLGLYAPDIYSAIENNGVIQQPD